MSVNGTHGFERKKNIGFVTDIVTDKTKWNPAARDDTLRSLDRHLSLKWTIDTLSTILIRSVNGPFER